MSGKTITIARQFGSGRREVAMRTAQELQIPLYDRGLVEMAAEKMGHATVSVERADESANKIFCLFSLEISPCMSYSNVSRPLGGLILHE